MEMQFNYMLVLRNSGTGKTSLVKTIDKDLKDQGTQAARHHQSVNH